MPAFCKQDNDPPRWSYGLTYTLNGKPNETWGELSAETEAQCLERVESMVPEGATNVAVFASASIGRRRRVA